MSPSLIDHTYTRLFNLQEPEKKTERRKSRRRRRKGKRDAREEKEKMHVSINHDLNQISTSARVLVDYMEK